jgi:hypothetical protein
MIRVRQFSHLFYNCLPFDQNARTENMYVSVLFAHFYDACVYERVGMCI